MKYEYKKVYESDTTDLTTEINKAGEEGWRLVSVCVADGGRSFALLEKIINE